MISFSLAEDKNYHTYKNVIKAVYDNRLIGIIMSYSSECQVVDEEMRNFVPGDRLEHVKNNYKYLSLITLADNSTAIELYKKFGFILDVVERKQKKFFNFPDVQSVVIILGLWNSSNE